MHLHEAQNANQINRISVIKMSYSIQVGDTEIEVTSVVNSVAVYNITVDVIRNTVVVGARGNAKTPVVIVNDMPCTIKWTTGREKMLFKKKTHFLDAVLRCRVPAGVTIVNTDIIEYNSKQYEIVDVVDFNNLGKILVIGLRKVE